MARRLGTPALQGLARPVLATVLALRVGALAAQEPPPVSGESERLEEVIVTGSRLPALYGASISPVTSVAASEIAATG